jgi:ATP-dependent protease HslVU (ClpYQ) peptidase subunit
MITCVVLRRNGEVAIAADALVTFGDTRPDHSVAMQ